MVREPTWQGPGETNWSLPAYRWRTAFRSSVMAIPGIINDVRLAAGQHRTARTLRQGSGIKLALGSGSTAPQGWYGLDLFRRGTRVMRANLLLESAGFVGMISMDSDRSEYFADSPPDVHPQRFPDEIPGVNFAVEARTP